MGNVNSLMTELADAVCLKSGEPNQYNPNQVFLIGHGFGLFLSFHYDYAPNGRRKRTSSPRSKRI